MNLNALKTGRKLLAYTPIMGLLASCLLLIVAPIQTATAINEEMNFQGRLLTAEGATVPDGYYNIQFKIYQDGDGQTAGNTTGTPAGTLLWTESHLNANGQGVTVRNGFMSVQLGSITPFGSSIDWSQDTLWLSMNVGNTNATCTPFSSCAPDGEMLPMKRLSATPFSLNSNRLGGLTSAQFLQLAQGVQTDATAGVPSIAINKTATGDLLALQSGGLNAFTLDNSGNILFGNNANHTISVAQSTTGGNSLTVAAGSAATGSGAAGGDLLLMGGVGDDGASGSVIIRSQTNNSTAALVVQNASNNSIFSVDTVNNRVGVNNLNPQHSLDVNGSLRVGTGGYDGLVANGDTTTFSGTTVGTATSYLSIVAAAGNQMHLNSSDLYINNLSQLNANGSLLVNTGAGGSNTIDLRVDGQSALFVSGSLDGRKVGIGTAAPNYKLDVVDGDGTGIVASFSGRVIGTDAVNSDEFTTLNQVASMVGSVSGNYVDLQPTSPGIEQDGSINISGIGVFGDSVLTNGIDTTVAGTLNIGQTNATSVAIFPDVTMSGNLAVNGGSITSDADLLVDAVGNLTLDSGAAATLQATNSVTINVNGLASATFDNSNSVYFGNGITAAAPPDFTISGTNSSTTAVTGGSITIQGGNATVGDANGGNLVLSGGTGIGTGASGLVILTTPTFSTTTNDPNCLPGGALATASCTVAISSVNNSSAILVGFSTTAQEAYLPDPTNATAGRVLYVTAANGSEDFTLSVNGGGTGNEVAMRQNTSATMIWNGTAWTAAGASSSTTLQAAYDNTLQSAGGAELVVSKTGNTNGLTIRESTVNPVDGTLLSVQTSSAASLFSINSNVTEYSTNGGAELIGSSGDTSFPSGSWDSIGAATVSRHTTAGKFIATGKGSTAVATTTAINDGVRNTLNTSLTAKTNYNVSFAARLTSGTFTDMTVYYSVDGTATSVPCTTNQAVTTSVWTKVNCTFTAPASGITASNAILIRQAGSGTARTFYLDNLSVTIAADYNYASDGSVSDAANFGTNWTAAGGSTVTRSISAGFDASDSAQVDTTGANQGVRNKLAVDPLSDTLYRITVYAASNATGFDNFTVSYSPDGGTSFVNCADYNTQTVSSVLTEFTKVTCYVTTGSAAVTNPYIYFTQTDATARTFYVDAFSMNLNSNSTPNVQIGGGVNGGPATLLTLDRAASAPIANNNEALLGSMYYDTSLGKLQCYEADGWGACGSSPDSIVTISPEYNNAVLHGTGVGTMVSNICSDTLNINDGSSGQATICGVNETYNFYKWTSPQATPQTYSIYVTYELPSNFNGFASGQTSLMGRSDSSNASVEYQVYKNDPEAGLTACGSPVLVSSGAVTSWQTGIANGLADPSTCSFAPGNSIVFKINVTASQNASAYVSNLNFTFNNN